MTRHHHWLACCLAFGLVACTNDTAMDHSATAMPGAPAAALAEHSTRGTLNSIDVATGSVNISHEAVASAGWPAMTMGFKLADPAAATSLAPGQHVEFRFTAENATVTHIAAAE